MPDIDWVAMLDSIKRCSAVYSPTQESAYAAFRELGCAPIAWYSDDEHQAIVSIAPKGQVTLTIAGTRVTEGSWKSRLGDLYEDAHFVPVASPGGLVACGAYRRAAIFEWAKTLYPGPFQVEGHSLGAQTAHLAPIFLPLERLTSIIAWEPPKAAEDAFYTFYAEWFKKCVTVVNGEDPWAAWPWISVTLRHPRELLWLNGNNWSVVPRDKWAGGSILHESDHDTGTLLAIVEKVGKNG